MVTEVSLGSIGTVEFIPALEGVIPETSSSSDSSSSSSDSAPL